eukprot:jgi/Ulvmu1/11785/UM008_0199.1
MRQQGWRPPLEPGTWVSARAVGSVVGPRRLPRDEGRVRGRRKWEGTNHRRSSAVAVESGRVEAASIAGRARAGGSTGNGRGLRQSCSAAASHPAPEVYFTWVSCVYEDWLRGCAGCLTDWLGSHRRAAGGEEAAVCEAQRPCWGTSARSAGHRRFTGLEGRVAAAAQHSTSIVDAGRRARQTPDRAAQRDALV